MRTSDQAFPAPAHPGGRRPGSSLARVVALLLASALVLGAAACGSSAVSEEATGTTGPSGTPAIVPISESPSPRLPVTVTGADGREVTVTDVSRIVPLWGNISETIFTLGLGGNVVGRDISTTFPEAEHLPLVTRAHDVSAEAVLSLNPTVVFAQTDTGPPEALEHLRNAGVPVVVLEAPTSVDEIGLRITSVAEALGVEAEGEALARRTQEQIAEVQEAIPSGEPKPKVAFLYMRGQAGVYLIAGPGSGADSMITAAGGVDAGTAMGLERSFTPLTSEAMVQAAPDVILMTTTGLESVGGIDGLVAMPGIGQTPAGRDRRVVTEEDGLLYSFGARTPAALAALIERIYSPVG